MGLEINLISFIPLIIDIKNNFSTESAIKYFLVQAFASLIFIFLRIFYIIKINLFFILINPFYEIIIINSTIIIKLGAAPFHFWFPSIIDGLSWNNSILLLTWQKIAPLRLISYFNETNLLILFIISSAIIGAIGGLNQISLRKLLSYSSINHISWLLIALNSNNILWITYFLFYIIINISIIFLFKTYQIFYTNQLFIFNRKFWIIKFYLFINLLSLGGLPPFLGFFPKWLVIENLINLHLMFILLILIIIRLVTLFFYLRLTFSAFLFLYPSFIWKKINLFSSIQNLNLYLNFFLSNGLILIILIYYYYF